MQPDPAIPASWPAGDPYLRRPRAALPALTYQQIFRDPRLQTLIAQALVNNRDLMVAAANIAAAREQYRIQRADQLPTVNANAGVTVVGRQGQQRQRAIPTRARASRASSSTCSAALRSLTQVQLERYLATEAGARATRLTLVADIASAWLTYAADSSLLLIAEQTAASAEKSVRLTRLASKAGSRRAPTCARPSRS